MKYTLLALIFITHTNLLFSQVEDQYRVYMKYKQNNVKTLLTNGKAVNNFIYTDSTITVYNILNKKNSFVIYYHGNNIIDSVRHYPNILNSYIGYIKRYSYCENGNIDYVYYSMDLLDCTQHNLHKYSMSENILFVNKFCTCDTIESVKSIMNLQPNIIETFEYNHSGVRIRRS